jgi:hypothetical protein
VGDAVAHLQEAARTDAQEAVPAEALAALDGLQEIRGSRAVVEPEKGTDRRLEIGVAGRAETDRVHAAGEALDLAEAERVLGGHRPRTSRDNETDLRPLGTNGRFDHPRCHPTSALPHSPDRRDGGTVRSALPAIAGALRRSLLERALPARSVRKLPGPFTAAATPVFHRPPGLSAGARRVLVPFTAHVFSCRGV